MRSPLELIRLAERYSHYLSERTANPYLAWGRLGQIIRALPPHQAFDLVCHFMRTLPRSCLPSFGGGIFAHLVDHHGEMLIDCIEREARRDVDFLTALSSAWVAGEGVHPTILIRLRVATGARIHIVRRPQRNAAYKATFERWITGRPQRLIRHRKHPVHMWSFAGEGDLDAVERDREATETDREAVSHSARPVARPRATTDVPMAWLAKMRMELWMRTSMWFQVFMLKLQYGRVNRSPLLPYMAKGAVIVWYFWLLMTMLTAPLVLPVLIAVLCIISASPVTDLIAVALVFILATIGGAVAGLVTGIVAERRRQFTNGLLYGSVLASTPYLTLIGLIARSEHGVVVAPVVVTLLAAGPFVWRLFAERTALRHA